MAFNPPLGDTSPAVLLDNATRLDKLVNGQPTTVPDRAGDPLYSWRGIHQNLIPLSRQYMTIEAAQADIANIPAGSTTFIRNEGTDSLAYEVMNTGGVLTPTGRKLSTQEYIDKLSNTLNFVFDSNAKNVSGFPGIAEMATDKNGNVTYQRLEDGTSQFPAVMVGSSIEQVQKADGSVFQSRASGTSVLSLSEDGSVGMLRFNTFFSADYPDYAEVHADINGEIFKIVKRNGEVIDLRDSGADQSEPVVSADGGMAIEVSGNLKFISPEGGNTDITTDGGNTSPVTFRAVDNSYFVKFASQEGGSGDYHLHRIKTDGRSRIRQGRAELVHIMLVGQSLSVGAASVVQAPVTTTARYPYGAVIFNGGPKYDSAHAEKSVSLSDLQYLVPAVENIGKA
ncbi:hypothetical protein GZZ85_05040, partial [Klebsiella aerogenes]|nr:hypothetical protein [Klebsiella aerogenes]